MTVCRHFTGVCYSAVVKAMAEEKQAYWLIDAIASHVAANNKFKAACAKDEQFRDMQIWVLEPIGDEFHLIAVNDIPYDKPVIEQIIPYTDFDFGTQRSVKLYCGYTMIGEKPAYLIYDPSEY